MALFGIRDLDSEFINKLEFVEFLNFSMVNKYYYGQAQSNPRYIEFKKFLFNILALQYLFEINPEIQKIIKIKYLSDFSQIFEYACEEYIPEIAQYIYHKQKSKIKTNYNNFFIQICRLGKLELAKFFINNPEINTKLEINNYLFYETISNNHLELAKYIYYLKPNLILNLSNYDRSENFLKNTGPEILDWLLEIGKSKFVPSDYKIFLFTCRDNLQVCQKIFLASDSNQQIITINLIQAALDSGHLEFAKYFFETKYPGTDFSAHNIQIDIKYIIYNYLNNLEILKWLKSKKNFNIHICFDILYKTAFKDNNLEIINWLFSLDNFDKLDLLTGFNHAVIHDYYDLARIISNNQNFDKNLLLSDFGKLFENSCLKNQLNRAKFLWEIKNKFRIDINLQDIFKLIIIYGYTDIIKWFMELKIPVNLK